MSYSALKKDLINFMDQLAPQRDRFIKQNQPYYRELVKFFNYQIPESSSVLEVGCGTGELLAQLKVKKSIGIDISSEMIKRAKEKYPHLDLRVMDVEALILKGAFDYIILSDTLNYCEDIQQVFHQLQKVSHRKTRVIITYHNYFWTPVLKIAEAIGLKMPSRKLNWLSHKNIKNLYRLEHFRLVKQGKFFLFPIELAFISSFINRIVAHLPILNHFALVEYLVIRPQLASQKNLGVSVIVPARNEEGNIERLVKDCPVMGNKTQIIFVEGHSKDNTWIEIQRVAKKYRKKFDFACLQQTGVGKADAVHAGFAQANQDLVMILDADISVEPWELEKFYRALVEGEGEMVMGTRLIYPMEKEAMRTLNIMGNYLFAQLFSWLLDQSVTDTLCGTKTMFREDWKQVMDHNSFFGDFDPFGDFELIFGASKQNLEIAEIPIRYKARQYGSTNISRFRHGLLLLKMWLFALPKLKFI